VNTGQLLGGELHIERDDRVKCAPVLVRIGAACDYAQSRVGPLTYLLGIEIPESARHKSDDKGRPLKLPDAIWASPVFTKPDNTEPYRLHVHMRFPVTIVPNDTKQWGVAYRLREQLLISLIAAASTYNARPGIVQLPVKSAAAAATA
jgi:hypothetical protein